MLKGKEVGKPMTPNPQVKCDVATCRYNVETNACVAAAIAVNGKAANAAKATECATFTKK